MIPLLVISSCCFLVPTIIGLKRGHRRDASAMAVLTGLSIWNHGTHQRLALVIDRAYAHAFAIRYAIRAIRLPGRICDWFIRAVFFTGGVCYMFELQQMNIVLHFALHVSTIVAFSSHMITKNGHRQSKSIPYK